MGQQESAIADQDDDDDYAVTLAHGHVDLIDRIAAEWRALASEGPCDEPFYDPAWVQAWIMTFGAGASIVLVEIRRGGVLRGVLPLISGDVGIGPIKLHTLFPATNSHFPRFDIVHGRGDGDHVATALWRFLQTHPRWDVLRIDATPDTGVASQILDLAAAAGYPTRHHRPDASPYMDLSQYPDDIDGIISSLPTKLRSQNRRALRRLREHGTIAFRVIGPDDGEEQRSTALSELYRLEASGWKGEAKTAISSNPVTEAFYNQIAADAAHNGSLSMAQLWCNDDIVATTLDLVWGTTLYQLKFGYDPEYRQCSPGHLLRVWSIQAARQRGLTIIDNCGRSDPHKLAWTKLGRPFSTCYIGNRTVKARLAWEAMFRIGPWVQRRRGRIPLPAALVQFLE